ncbi:MBL fold metallo-hydrolase [[Actinomadura] parvosata]|uniref:MBL fold metallo-hydrolase n=1 Tax=[Actinomadura] parvosata TaxID=1955412 RepID=UPI00406CED80
MRADEENLPRQECAVTVLGGPTAVIDLGGLRIVVDPTFDDPGPHGYLTKTIGPAVPESRLGPVDAVLVSHDAHPDNLDGRGRAFAMAAPLTLTVPGAAGRLGPRAAGLAPWSTRTLPRRDGGGGELTVQAVPAVHGPEDGERDPQGHINCEVTGFVLSGTGLPTVYVSGDNASMRAVAEIARRVPDIDAAVLNAGAARVRGKFRERPVSMDARRVAAAAAVLGVAVVIPAHYDGWTHFSEGRAELETAFDEAGLSALLRLTGHGSWSPLRG